MMERGTSRNYSPPVDQLLSYGEVEHSSREDWPDYQQLGLGPEQIPDLIRMATDQELRWADSESQEVWAPLHAWRTLGQLRAESAIEPLLREHETLIEDDDWALEELPEVFGLIGPAALPPLAAYLADDLSEETSRI